MILISGFGVLMGGLMMEAGWGIESRMNILLNKCVE